MSDFSKKFIEKQQKRLLEAREQILENFKNFNKEAKDDGKNIFTEEGDIAQQYLDQKLNISLREKDLYTLKEIDRALQKIDDGTYGYCEESGEPIEEKRLEKRPWARLSLYYAELEERERQRYSKRAI
ncbi:MAG: TraR/DksA family transcriptional regulator [Halobacteriovoraceae bacterium]|nr:TraR/DksA family transcriptional regulator [Halobacteriovoraceae bacterium]MCB9093594.1 TraR/DksA family transcriptional regulator [Halobacteriovoraceae bacterium]